MVVQVAVLVAIVESLDDHLGYRDVTDCFLTGVYIIEHTHDANVVGEEADPPDVLAGRLGDPPPLAGVGHAAQVQALDAVLEGEEGLVKVLAHRLENAPRHLGCTSPHRTTLHYTTLHYTTLQRDGSQLCTVCRLCIMKMGELLNSHFPLLK